MQDLTVELKFIFELIMVWFLEGNYLKKSGLGDLNQFLARQGLNFNFDLITKNNFQLQNPTIEIVFVGKGEISGKLSAEFEPNDILFLDRGDYQLSSTDFEILTISGPNLFERARVIKQAEIPILPSTLGGTRKLLKDNNGKFNIDIHLIWVDKKNIKIPHYHRRLFELYLTESGRGEILLKQVGQPDDLAALKLKPEGFVLIPPNTVHRAVGDNLVIQVVGIPAFYHDDYTIVGENG